MEMQCTHQWPQPEGTPPIGNDSTRTSTLRTNEAQSKLPEPRHRRSGRGRRARRQAQKLSHITEVSGSPCPEDMQPTGQILLDHCNVQTIP